MTKLDRQIQSLNAGETLELSSSQHGSTWVERSGDGQTLRFVREIGNTQTVFKTCPFTYTQP